MKKRITALVLAFGMSVQMTGIVQAQALETSPADVPEVSYVIMAEDAEEVQEVTGSKIQEEDTIETDDCEIVTVELSEEEAEELEKLDVIIEEDIPFCASVLDGGSTEGQEYINSEEDAGNTEEPEDSEGAEELETLEEAGESEEPEEKEESFAPEDAEEASEEAEESEAAKDGEGQRTQKEEARDDWNLAAVHADTYAKEEASGEPVKIAVLDSGVNYRESLPVYGRETEVKGMESNPFFEDATGHGTAVASLIASSPDGESIRGINRDAEVYSVQVLGADNCGTLSGVVQGIYWAIENDMDIINMSFGTPHSSEILEKAIQDAGEAGILLVAAAGNDADSAVSYPAAYDGVCAVGSSSPEGEIAADSTRGEDVDIYAPGEIVMVNAPLFGTQIEGGSSLACAQVSGAASLLWEKDRTKDAQFIRALLEGTANVGIDPEYGRGLLDVEQAAEEFDSFVPESKEASGEEQIQEKPLPEFDEAELRALWKKGDHQKMVDGNADEYQTMRVAAAFPDERTKETNPLKKDRRFHGARNYLATLKFLVNLAHAYYVKDDGDRNKVYAWADDRENIKKVSKYGEITENIKWFLKQEICPHFKNGEEGFRRNKAYKIMGVAIHVAGDIYAHRSIVTYSMIKNAMSVKDIKNKDEADEVSIGYRKAGYFVKEDFNKWSDFVTEVKKGEIEFRDIADFQLDTSASRYYEDNIYIQRWRYDAAKDVVKALIVYYSQYSFRTHKWNVNVMEYRSRLASVITDEQK